MFTWHVQNTMAFACYSVQKTKWLSFMIIVVYMVLHITTKQTVQKCHLCYYIQQNKMAFIYGKWCLRGTPQYHKTNVPQKINYSVQQNKMAVIYGNWCVHGTPQYHKTKHCPKKWFLHVTVSTQTKQNGCHLWYLVFIAHDTPQYYKTNMPPKKLYLHVTVSNNSNRVAVIHSKWRPTVLHRIP